MKIGFYPIKPVGTKNIKKINVASPKVKNAQKTNDASLASNIASYEANISFGQNIAQNNYYLQIDFSERQKIYEGLKKGSLEDAKRILDEYKNDNADNFLKAGITYDETPLYCAAGNENHEVIQLLCDEFKDKEELVKTLTKQNLFGDTSFHAAAENKNPKVMKTLCDLFESNEDKLKQALTLRNKCGLTPIHIAALSNNIGVISIIGDVFSIFKNSEGI